MRVAITGATGNLGTALLRRLVGAEQEHELVGVVRRPPPPEPPYDTVEWHEVDLGAADAAQRLRTAFDGADAVVHLAWLFQPARDVDYLERVAVGGSRAVLEAADACGVGHLVHLSSLGAYSPLPDAWPLDRRVDESWPTEGISSLSYSRHKVAVERLLDAYEGDHPDGVTVTRVRPGIVAQRDAGSAILRYGAPGWLPGAALALVPVVPLDRSLAFQCVHSDDVADALVRVLDRRPGGAFNLAAEPPITAERLAAALGARVVHLPFRVLRTATTAAFRLRLHPLDPGWLDLAFAVPLMDVTRAREELGWQPTVDAEEALRELFSGMTDGVGTGSPVLRPRSVLGRAKRLAGRGPVSERPLT